jgi:hypothetical protein
MGARMPRTATPPTPPGQTGVRNRPYRRRAGRDFAGIRHHEWLQPSNIPWRREEDR